MFSLVKRHFMLNGILSYLGVGLLLTILYIGTIPPYFLFTVFFLGFVLSSIYYDDKHTVQRFIISLPVSKRMIVQSQYYSSLIIAVVILISQYLLMLIISNTMDGPHYVYQWKDLIILICLAMIITSIILPLYHTIKSLLLLLTIGFIGLFISIYFLLDGLVNVLNLEDVIIFNDLDPGFSLLVEKYIPFQPYLVLVFLAIVFVIGSMFYTEKVFHRTDQ